MAIPWLTLLKTVPWTDVIAHAPSVAHGARKLWHSVSGRSGPPEIPPPASPSASPDDRLAALEAEVEALGKTVSELHRRMVDSSALIRELAEQHTALIRRVESLRLRLLWLYGALALLFLLALAALFQAGPG